MNVVWICVGVIAGAIVVEGTTTARPITCDSVPAPCKENQFCVMVASAPVCRVCNEACDGCTNLGNSQCIACKPGFIETADVCLACPRNTFGVNCTGTCHCQLGADDYINAVFLDGHRQKNHYLLTQTPLHTTVIDFWKLVYDHDVHTVVMMEPMLYDDDTSAEYWPEDHMKQFEPFFIETTDVYQQENITIRNLKVVSMHNPDSPHMVRQFQFNAWSDSEFVPKSKSMLLDVVDLVNSWQISASNDTTPILVHCKDGATHSGLFIAVSFLCEAVLDDSDVDIYHVIKHLKRRRNQIVDMLDQYRFCYKALWDFINMRMPNGTLTSQMSRTKSDIPYKSLSLSSYSSKHEYMPY